MPGPRDLYSAIEADQLDRIREVLTMRPSLVNAVEETPPPIHWAIYHDKREAVELLLDLGANIELRDQDRDATPLDYAIVYARKDIIRIMVSRGANLEGRLRLAAKGAAGGFEAFGDLPDRRQYEEVVALLGELGAKQ